MQKLVRRTANPVQEHDRNTSSQGGMEGIISALYKTNEKTVEKEINSLSTTYHGDMMYSHNLGIYKLHWFVHKCSRLFGCIWTPNRRHLVALLQSLGTNSIPVQRKVWSVNSSGQAHGRCVGGDVKMLDLCPSLRATIWGRMEKGGMSALLPLHQDSSLIVTLSNFGIVTSGSNGCWMPF